MYLPQDGSWYWSPGLVNGMQSFCVNHCSGAYGLLRHSSGYGIVVWLIVADTPQLLSLGYFLGFGFITYPCRHFISEHFTAGHNIYIYIYLWIFSCPFYHGNCRMGIEGKSVLYRIFSFHLFCVSIFPRQL